MLSPWMPDTGTLSVQSMIMADASLPSGRVVGVPSHLGSSYPIHFSMEVAGPVCPAALTVTENV